LPEAKAFGVSDLCLAARRVGSGRLPPSGTNVFEMQKYLGPASPRSNFLRVVLSLQGAAPLRAGLGSEFHKRRDLGRRGGVFHHHYDQSAGTRLKSGARHPARDWHITLA
jgi:hypothetical protein